MTGGELDLQFKCAKDIQSYPQSSSGFIPELIERHGVNFTEKYDSLEFAYFVMPTNPHGHSTSAMSDYFGLPEIEHRALPDCEAEFGFIRHLLVDKFKPTEKTTPTRTNWLLGQARLTLRKWTTHSSPKGKGRTITQRTVPTGL